MTEEQRQEIMRRQAEGMRALSQAEMDQRQLDAAQGMRQRGPATLAETVSECIRLRGLPAAKIGRAWVLVEADVIDWLRQQYIEHGATMKHKTAKLTGAPLSAHLLRRRGEP